MEKKYVDDVIPPKNKRSIRDIPVPLRNKNADSHKRISGIRSVKNKEPRKIKYDGITDREIDEELFKPDRSHSKFKIAAASVFFILVLLFVSFSLMNSAVVTITAKSEEVNINTLLDVSLISNSTNEVLGYREIELDKEVSIEVTADKEEFVENSASGTIIVYNNYSSTPQRLIRQTRFESPEGKIYRIRDSIEIPGYTEKAGERTPGSIEVLVYADEAGDDYNINESSFTIPGFKGQPQFELFSAETNTPISGGFSGVRKIVDDDDLNIAKSELKKDLTESLIDELNNQITEDFIAVYDNDSFIYFDVNQEESKDSEKVTLKMSGSINAKLFNTNELSQKVAMQEIQNFDTLSDQVLIKNIREVDIEYVNKTKDTEASESDDDSKESDNEYDQIKLSGNARFVWQNNEEEIKLLLLGLNKKEISGVFAGIKGVSSANAKIKPFWSQDFPNKASKIKIEISE